MPTDPETTPEEVAFDFSAFPLDTCFHERRTGRDRRRGYRAGPDLPRVNPVAAPARRKVERRRRVDPTTFEKQYSTDEIEFMNAMQYYKVQTGKTFPTYQEVLHVAHSLGYHRPDRPESEVTSAEPCIP